MKDKEINLSERVAAFKNACAFRLMSGIPFIASVSIVKKSGKEIADKDVVLSAEKSAKICRASSILLKDNKFYLIIPATYRWSDMIGEGYISRISSIIGASIGSLNLPPCDVIVDVWSIPNEHEIYKFVRLKSSECNPKLFRRTDVFSPLSPEEIETLPLRHAARSNNKLPIQRILYKQSKLELSGPNEFLLTVKEIFDENTQKTITVLENKPTSMENG